MKEEKKDPFVPTYGKGDVIHDCPKHVEVEGFTGTVVNHTLTESGDVNFIDIDFGTGKVYENVPVNKVKITEMREHAHNIKEEPKLKREIDFKDKEAFKKYDDKHKMRPDTKVTIAGKTTTAGKVFNDKTTSDGDSATKIAAAEKSYRSKPAKLNPASGLSDQSIKKITKNVEEIGGTMPDDFSGSESSAEGILNGLETIMNTTSLHRPYIHHVFSQMTQKQAYAGLDALKKKYSYDKEKIVKPGNDPETGEYRSGNEHWEGYYETTHGKVKQYQNALSKFETPISDEKKKSLEQKIAKQARPDYMHIAVSGAGKYKEDAKIAELRSAIKEMIQDILSNEKV